MKHILKEVIGDLCAKVGPGKTPEAYQIDHIIEDISPEADISFIGFRLQELAKYLGINFKSVSVEKEGLKDYLHELHYPALYKCDSSREMWLFTRRKNKLFFTRYTIDGQQEYPLESIDDLGDEVKDMDTLELLVALPDQSLFDQGEMTDTAKYKGKPLQRFLKLISLDKKDIMYLYLYAFISGAISLSLPLGIQALVGIVMGGQLATSWYVLVFFVMIGILLTGIFQMMQLSISEVIQQRLFARASFEFAYRIPRLKMEALTGAYAPELVNRFFDTLSVQKGLSKVLMDFTSSSLQIIFGLLLLSFYHPFFILFGLILLFFLAIVLRFTAPYGMRTSLKESTFKYQVAHWLEEMGRSIDTFKLTGYTNLPYEKTDNLVSKYLDARKAHFRVLLFQYGNVVGFKTLITAGLLIIGSFLVINQQINIGQFVAAEIVIILLINSVEKLILSMESIYDVLTATEKIGNVTDLPVEAERGISFRHLHKGKGVNLHLEKVGFRYRGGDKKVLDNISFDVPPGGRVCITGPNGSGKSTLVNLIAGLYEEFEGSVTYNDVPFNNINLTSLRHFIGDNLSSEDIFLGTMEENITMGRNDIELKNVINVCEEVGLMEFVKNLPDGFSTELMPDDRRVPKSVVRKIILARSIVNSPPLLVIDDLMLNIDRTRREDIVDMITHKDAPWTLVVASNDPMVMEQCDKTIILESGRVSASGTFQQLREKGLLTDKNNGKHV